MYDRSLAPLLSRSSRSALVLGPRQVGKSTILRALGPDLIINLASPSEFRNFATHPERLEQELRASAPGVKTVLIDEIQRVPELFNVLQLILDESPGRFRFLLSGSSARKLRRGQANLLPGRIHTHYMHPLLVCEMGDDFRLDKVLALGSLPGIYAQSDQETREADLRSYADIYLREEVQAEALVRDIGGYGRLLELLAASSGRVLNVRALCQDAGISYETARRYMEVMEDTLLTFRVPAWSGADRASLVAHPKVYLFDLGVRNALLRRPLDLPQIDERGLLLEHLVAYELHRRVGSHFPRAKLSYFRTRQGAEVDFVFEVDHETWAIEVKASSRFDASMLKGHAVFAARARKVHRKLVVFLGPRRQILEGVEALPLSDFLGLLPKV